MKPEKFEIQDSKYGFPYHYLADVDEKNRVSLHRQLRWGLDYMTYITFLLSETEKRAPRSLLDVGCGDGRFIHLLKGKVPRAVGIDLSEAALRWAKCFNPETEFICDNIAHLDERFDLVLAIEVLEHIPEEKMRDFVHSLRAVTNPEGRLLVSVPTQNVPLNKKHYRHYTLDILAAQLSDCFEVESHWWLHKTCFLSKMLRMTLCNSYFTVNHPKTRSRVWRIHKRFTYNADASTGRHLICMARPR